VPLTVYHYSAPPVVRSSITPPSRTHQYLEHRRLIFEMKGSGKAYFCSIVFSGSGSSTFPCGDRTTGLFKVGCFPFPIFFTITLGPKSLVCPASIIALFKLTPRTCPCASRFNTMVGRNPFAKLSAEVIEVDDFQTDVIAS